MLVQPAIAKSGFAALGAVTSCPATAEDLPVSAVMCPELLQRFVAVSDGRHDQGQVHPVAVVLVLCVRGGGCGGHGFVHRGRRLDR